MSETSVRCTCLDPYSTGGQKPFCMIHDLAPTETVEHGEDDIVERETHPAILSGQLRFMARTLDGERRACVIDAADALDVQRAEIRRLRSQEPVEKVRYLAIGFGGASLFDTMDKARSWAEEEAGVFGVSALIYTVVDEESVGPPIGDEE